MKYSPTSIIIKKNQTNLELEIWNGLKIDMWLRELPSPIVTGLRSVISLIIESSNIKAQMVFNFVIL